MNQITRFTTPGGEQMVILTAADYERLIEAREDAEDIAAYDRAKARLASGEDELVPAVVVNRLLAGESPVRVWREHRGMSATQLAEAADISGGFLSQIEKGDRDGSLGVMRRIARALGVALDDIVPSDE